MHYVTEVIYIYISQYSAGWSWGLKLLSFVLLPGAITSYFAPSPSLKGLGLEIVLDVPFKLLWAMIGVVFHRDCYSRNNLNPRKRSPARSSCRTAVTWPGLALGTGTPSSLSCPEWPPEQMQPTKSIQQTCFCPLDPLPCLSSGAWLMAGVKPRQSGSKKSFIQL